MTDKHGRKGERKRMAKARRLGETVDDELGRFLWGAFILNLDSRFNNKQRIE